MTSPSTYDNGELFLLSAPLDGLDFTMLGAPESPRGNENLFTTLLFEPLWVHDSLERERGAVRITEKLKESLNDDAALLKKHLDYVVRLADDCPFEGVRNHFKNFLEDIREELECRNIKMPEKTIPTRIFPEESLVKIDTSQIEAAEIFQQCFLRDGFISNLARVLAWHPSYHGALGKVFDFIMTGSGSLPQTWKHYIAISAVAQYKCSYLVKQQEIEFLECGGDKKWLTSFSNLPVKLQNLAKINSTLAHQPWRLTQDDIHKLIKIDGWTLPDLIQCLVIMASFRALAAFVWATGVVHEESSHNETLVKVLHHDEGDYTSEVDTEFVINRLRRKSLGADDKLNTTENTKLFVDCSELAILEQFSGNDSTVEEYSYSGWSKELELAFKTPYSNITYEDFVSKHHGIFDSQDFSWNTHAYSLLSSFYPGAEPVLDSCFKCIQKLTYSSFNVQKSIDTEPFRHAIWFYALCLNGIFNDAFDYQQVELLTHQIKSFVKKISSVPYTINVIDVSHLGVRLLPEEKAHIALLASEARKQAELLYGLKMVSKFLSSKDVRQS